MNFFSLIFYFSVCVSCLFPAHPVMFTSCHLYVPHVTEYLLLLIWLEEVIILFRPTFTIVLANHSNACKIVCILFSDWHSYFNFLHPSWVSLNSQHIRIDTQFVQHNLNNPNSVSTIQKKNNRNNANNFLNQWQEYSNLTI